VPLEYGSPVQVEAFLFRKKKDNIEYLVLKRTSERGGFWQPITGALEKGESKIQALRREIEEETGITNFIEIIEDIYHFEFNDPSLYREYVFGVEVSPEEKIVINEKEHSAFRWCCFEEAFGLIRWDENKVALRKLGKILTLS
jgi:8-oxo-dGTP pyrophosphatase MutT (NUDIX family)